MTKQVRKQKSKRRRRRDLHCKPIWESLLERCLAPIRSFGECADRVDTTLGPYFYQDNGADVLAVAHLDTVQNNRHFGSVKGDSGRIYNCQLDDRLGAWLILDLFPSMGLNMDVLLTTGEEHGQSTAQAFTTDKSYNWIAEFDRSGTDVVTYDLDSQIWLDCIGEKTPIGWGSYSDIAELEHLACCAANWGVGYYRNHDRESHFIVSELSDTVDKFEKFYHDYFDQQFPIEHIKKSSWLDYVDDEEYAYDDEYLSVEDKVTEDEWRAYFQKYSNTGSSVL